MLNKRRGGHVQSRGRALKSITKERVESIVTSVDDRCDNRARSLKVDVPPVLPLGKQNLLVGFQSSSSDNVDEESCPVCVINRGQLGNTTVCMPTALRGSQTHRYRSFIMKLAIGKQSVYKMKVKRSRTVCPEREGDVTMLLIIMCTS